MLSLEILFRTLKITENYRLASWTRAGRISRVGYGVVGVWKITSVQERLTRNLKVANTFTVRSTSPLLAREVRQPALMVRRSVLRSPIAGKIPFPL